MYREPLVRNSTAGSDHVPHPMIYRDRLHQFLTAVVTVLTLVGTAPAPVFALPGGAQVAHGSATLDQSGATLTVRTPSDRLVINYESFSIGVGELVQFLQPGANAVALNRVVGSDLSTIMGMLQANGKVNLLNPNGVLFGPTAQVNVHSLLASSLNMADADFLSGSYRFDGGSTGFVINTGTITAAPGGSIFLISPSPSNFGTRNAPEGQVGLVAGTSVLLTENPNGWIAVQLDVAEGEALNTGKILANAGKVGLYGKAVRQAGVIEANATELDDEGNIVLLGTEETTVASGSRTVSGGGKIVVETLQGTTLVSGSLDASDAGPGKTGGIIHVLGKYVGLLGGAVVDASGDAGGGTVLVGGDREGQGAVRMASRTYVSPGSVVSADAITSGNGGQVIFNSVEATRYYGSASARGGETAGDGGFIEVSGDYVAVEGAVDTLAPNGSPGDFLIDPTIVEVVTGGLAALTDVDAFAAPGATVQIDPSTISSAKSNVTLLATEDILFKNAVSMSRTGVGITAKAGDDVHVQPGATITTRGGSVSLTASEASSGSATSHGWVWVQAAITTGGGNITLDNSNGTTEDIYLEADLNAIGGGNVAITSSDDIDITAGTISSDGSTGVSMTALDKNSAGDIWLQGGTVTQSGAGSVTLDADDDIEITGSAAITHSGSGGVAMASGDDIWLSDSSSVSHSSSGSVTLEADDYIYLDDSSSISHSGSGSVSLDADDYDIELTDSSSISHSGSGSVSLSAYDDLHLGDDSGDPHTSSVAHSGSGNLSLSADDVRLYDDTSIRHDGTGTITVSPADDLELHDSSSISSNGQTIVLQAEDIDLGGTVNSGSGDIFLRPNSTSADMFVAPDSDAADTFDLLSSDFGNITSSGTVTIGPDSGTGDLYLKTLDLGPAGLNKDFDLTLQAVNIQFGVGAGSPNGLLTLNTDKTFRLAPRAQFWDFNFETDIRIPGDNGKVLIDLGDAIVGGLEEDIDTDAAIVAGRITGPANLGDADIHFRLENFRASGFSIGTVDYLSGLSTRKGNIEVLTHGPISVDEEIHANEDGSVTITSESGTISINAAILSNRFGRGDGAGGITLAADDQELSAELLTTGTVTFQEHTPGRPINLGTEASGTLGLTDREGDNVPNAGTIRFGSANAGTLSVVDGMTMAESTNLELVGDEVNVDDVVKAGRQTGNVTVNPASTGTPGDVNVGDNNNGQVIGNDIVINGVDINVGDGDWMGRINAAGAVTIDASGDFILPRRARIIANGNVIIRADGNVRIDGVINILGSGSVTIVANDDGVGGGDVVLGANDHTQIVAPKGTVSLTGDTVTRGGFGYRVKIVQQ